MPGQPEDVLAREPEDDDEDFEVYIGDETDDGEPIDADYLELLSKGAD